MAKSLRSKHKRRMRAIKRIRYGEKELKILKEMVEKTKEKESKDEEILKQIEKNDSMNVDFISVDNSPDTIVNKMQVDHIKPKHSRKTMKDEHGQYPEWMNGRRLKKQKMLVKYLKNKKKNKSKK